MKNFKPVLILALFIVVLLGIKFMFFPSAKDDEGNKAKSNMPKPAVNIDGFIVRSASLDNRLFISGSILANESVEIRSEISGKVDRILLKEGEPVSKGQLLVKLVDTDLQAQLHKTNASLKLAQVKKDRISKLLKVQGVSQEEFDNADNEAESLIADAEVLKVQISRTELRAPFNGVLGLRNISEGSYISPAQIVATIQQLNPVKIEFSIPEKYSGKIKNGTTIYFLTEASDEQYSGTVYAIEPNIDPVSRTLKVRATAPNMANKLMPGSFVKVDLLMGRQADALLIPSQAIVPVLKGQQVFVAREGVAVAIPVKIGMRNDSMVHVIDGLTSGDTVVTTGVMGVRQGSKLKMLHVK
ncbi:efflux RND transporter periplasmic adaptor subunit [soil metagenome]